MTDPRDRRPCVHKILDPRRSTDHQKVRLTGAILTKESATVMEADIAGLGAAATLTRRSSTLALASMSVQCHKGVKNEA